MSIRTALLGGLLIVGCTTLGVVAVMGAVNISQSVFSEAQGRVNHDLDTAVALYRQNLDTLGDRFAQLVASGTLAADTPDLAARLQRWRTELDLDVLNCCDPDGQPLAGAYGDAEAKAPVSTDPVLRRSLSGKPAQGTVVLNPERLTLEGGQALRNLVTVAPAADGNGAASALFQWFAAPVLDAGGKVTAVVYGGRALNHNYRIVDGFRDVIFGKDQTYNRKPLGAVTVFLDNTRVATNVLNPQGARAIGTTVSGEVHQAVLVDGQRWRARAWVVDSWYLSGYDPLRDPDGTVVGMLYVGLLEAPYDAVRGTLLRRFLIPAGAVLLIGLAATWLLVQRITQPLSTLQHGAHRIGEGDWDHHIAEGRTYLEIRDLASSLRHMQAAIAERDRKLRQQYAQLEQTNNQLNETNANYMQTLRFITHEMKSPLAAIQAIIDTLVGGLMGDLPERTRHLLVRIKRNCEELQDMVKNYLDLARAERGELVADKTDIDLREDVLAPAVAQTEPLMDSRNITLEVICPADIRLHADAELLRIAVANYLSNACKYGREGGQARLAATREGDAVTVSVWNEGPGFTAEEGQMLFGKFSRLKNTNTRDKRGSGLGLFITSQIAAQHDAEVAAESEPGQWAKFILRLPLAQ